MDLSGQPFAGTRILLVEDDPQAVGILEPILIAKGFSVAVARDGVEGLEKVKLQPPDILLLAVTMPRMDGLTTLQELRRLKPGQSYSPGRAVHLDNLQRVARLGMPYPKFEFSGYGFRKVTTSFIADWNRLFVEFFKRHNPSTALNERRDLPLGSSPHHHNRL